MVDSLLALTDLSLGKKKSPFEVVSHLPTQDDKAEVNPTVL